MNEGSERLFEEIAHVIGVARSKGRVSKNEIRAAVDRVFCTLEAVIERCGREVPAGVLGRTGHAVKRFFARVVGMGRVTDESAQPHRARTAA